MCRFSTISSKQQGSILLESLLAAAILSVCLAVFIQTFILGFRTVQEMEDYSTAILLLENKMIPLVQNGFIAESVIEEGAFEKPYEKFKYFIEAYPAHQRFEGELISEVKLTVRWSSNKRAKDVSLVTYLFKRDE